MSSNIYMADFETTTENYSNDMSKVWLWGSLDFKTEKKLEIGLDIKSFMEWIQTITGQVYFHNLAFDGKYIVSWLLNNGYTHVESRTLKSKEFSTIISDSNLWYEVKINVGFRGKRAKVVKINDSLKKLPFSLKRVAKAFEIEQQKLTMDYDDIKDSLDDLTENDKQYLLHDLKIPTTALKKQFEQGLTKMTIGSDALNDFKSMYGEKEFYYDFPKVDEVTNKFIHNSYRGGWTHLKKGESSKDQKQGIAFDVNSLYPFVMRHKLLPFGLPLHYKGRYKKNVGRPLYIQRIETSFTLKEGYLPTIQIKNDKRFKGNEYLESSVDKRGKKQVVYLTLTNVDLELFLEHYDQDYIRYIDGYMFQGKYNMFNNYIDKWTIVKTTTTGALQQIAKLMLNSLYGKFGSKTDVTPNIPMLDDKGILILRPSKNEKTKDPVYTALASFVTSYAREITITTAQKVYPRFIYGDTDSIYLKGTETPKEIEDIIHPKKLGYWGHEGTFTRGRFIKQKTYVVDLIYNFKRDEHGKFILDDGKKVKEKAFSLDSYDTKELKVTCVGMKDEVKEQVTFDNFFIGSEFSGNKKSQSVRGGVLIKDTTYKMT